MAAFEIIFSQARRQCISSSSSQTNLLFRLYSSSSSSSIRNVGFSRFPFVEFPRSFSSSPSSSDPPSDNQSEVPSVDSSRSPPPSASVKPVSYAIKPVDPSSTEETAMPPPQRIPRRPRDAEKLFSRSPATDSESAKAPEPRPWTREEIRYVKDVPSISPVSYPTRVAPLPEDRVSASAEDAAEDARKEEEKKDNEQLEKERRRIEADVRFRRSLKIEEEIAPFPTLITVEKKKQKVVIDLQEAIKGVKANAKSNFNETVEAHVNLGVDPRRGDQMVRGATTLPHGTGKTVRVAVFAEGAVAEEARAAGADLVGGDELIEEIKNGGGKLSFDKCISTPTFMPRLGKIARILGPRGMMPNPKLGSVTSDVATAVKEAKRGRIDFKIDKTAIVHVGLGKVSFPEEALRENIGAFVNALLLAKPVGLKKTSKYAGYVKNFTLSCTMGPGFPVSIQSLSIAADQYNKQQQLK